MDQSKIGKFISERRKSVNLTQMQLAEKLNITDRAISKWETGKALPDSSIMLELCEILKINVNDLLSGEIVSMDNYNKEMENKLIEMVKEKEEGVKKLLTLEWILITLSMIVILIPCAIVAYLGIEDLPHILILFSGFIPGIIGLVFATKIEQTAGYYKCAHCSHKHVPTFNQVLFSMHFGRTRYIKCPNCHKRSWQKKVIKKD